MSGFGGECEWLDLDVNPSYGVPNPPDQAEGV